MSSPNLVVHHLQIGQGERTIWLLEELGLPYKLQLYKRSPLLSPPELQAKYPMGAAPLLEDFTDASNPILLAESGAISDYVIHKYGNGKLALGPTHPNFSHYLYWFHFCNATLLSNVFRRALARGYGTDDPRYQGSDARAIKAIAHLDNRLLETNAWLAGQEFTAADIMMGFNMTTMRKFEPIDLTEYKGIQQWLKRIGERDAYRRAMSKGDPDLDVDAGLSAKGPEVFQMFVNAWGSKK